MAAGVNVRSLSAARNVQRPTRPKPWMAMRDMEKPSSSRRPEQRSAVGTLSASLTDPARRFGFSVVAPPAPPPPLPPLSPLGRGGKKKEALWVLPPPPPGGRGGRGEGGGRRRDDAEAETTGGIG